MSEQHPKPDFESIKQLNLYGIEYWSARDLQPLLGYSSSWQNFDTAIKRAKLACEQSGNEIKDHFNGAIKMVPLGSGAVRKTKDHLLTRFACYLVAQNGDPRKPEIAAAQAYFATSARENELRKLKAQQDERLFWREQINEGNKDLAAAAYNAGVNSANFGTFQNAGYAGLYGGLNVEDIKRRKNIPAKEDLLDRAGRAELAANFFRVTQTEQKLRVDNIQGEQAAISTHHEVGQEVRKSIQKISNIMPEDLPAEPSIKPLLDEKKRGKKKAVPPQGQPNLFDETD